MRSLGCRGLEPVSEAVVDWNGMQSNQLVCQTARHRFLQRNYNLDTAWSEITILTQLGAQLGT